VVGALRAELSIRDAVELIVDEREDAVHRIATVAIQLRQQPRDIAG
jgi:hypothetical protein